METKKSPLANLENKRSLFFQIGLIIALSIVLIAFEWSTRYKDKVTAYIPIEDIPEIDLIPITRNEPEREEPPKPEVTLIEIVPDEDPVLNEKPFFNPEINEKEGFGIEKWTEIPDEKPEATEEIFIKVEDMPKFNGGGINEFWKYVQEHVEYPEEARDIGLQGKILVYFVVNQKGNITNIEVKRGIHPLLDNEVVKTLNEAPLWEPGKQHNRPVKVCFSIPVVFKISD